MKDHYASYLFDLDGTLVDSAPDIGAALNHSLAAAALPKVSMDLVRHWIGHGSRTLVTQALAHHKMHTEEARVDSMLAPFLEYYNQHIADYSQVYPNAAETLTQLKDAGASLAVVTNKLTELSIPLLRALALEDYFDLIVCGDTTEHPKPAPDPILYCLNFFQLKPAQALMVGDSNADVEAARAAKVDVACLRDGYNHGVDVKSLNPDKVIDDLKELI